MLKVLIVDDNHLIRQSLIKRIDWEGLELVCAGEAADGHEAYEKIKKLHPSIVITDVRMPIADGFYTIDRCRDNEPEVQFIIISGYDDFPYVKKAVQRDVVDYILKPIDTEELHSTLKRAKERVMQYRTRLLEKNQTHQFQRHYQEQKVSNLFLSFFAHKIDYMDLTEQLRQADYPLNEEYCACMCVNICAPHGDSTRALSPTQIVEIEQGLERAYLNSTCKFLHIYRNIYLVVCTYRDPVRYIASIQKQLFDVIEHTFLPKSEEKLFLSFSSVMASDRLHEAYHQCFQQMMQRFVTPDVQLLYTPIHASRNQLNSQYQQLFENLKISMALRMKEEAKTLIHRLVSGIRQEPLLLQEYLPRVFLLIDQELENQLSICEFDPSFQQFYMLRFFDLEQIEQTMCRLVDTIPELRESVDIGDKVIDYIDKHYTQPLTLRSLGELFHFNQIYLGQLIKRKTGILFNGYLNQLRIEKAKELIRTDPELLLKDLAYQLGYTDSHYFTKVFRQYVGVTPTEYKEKMGAS